MSNPISQSQRRNTRLGALLAAATITGCASLPSANVDPSSLLIPTHTVFAALDAEMLRLLETANHGAIEKIIERYSPRLEQFVERTERAFVSLDPRSAEVGGSPDFRVLLVGSYPAASFWIASLFSPEIWAVRLDRLWYVADDRFAFTLIGGDLLIAAEPAALEASKSTELDLFGRIGVGGVVLAARITDSAVIIQILENQGVPIELARRFAIDRLDLELRRDGNRNVLSFKSSSPGELEARLLGAGLLLILDRSILRGFSRDGATIEFELELSAQQIADLVTRVAEES